jgi:hypothetical protein
MSAIGSTARPAGVEPASGLNPAGITLHRPRELSAVGHWVEVIKAVLHPRPGILRLSRGFQPRLPLGTILCDLVGLSEEVDVVLKAESINHPSEGCELGPQCGRAIALPPRRVGSLPSWPEFIDTALTKEGDRSQS